MSSSLHSNINIHKRCTDAVTLSHKNVSIPTSDFHDDDMRPCVCCRSNEQTTRDHSDLDALRFMMKAIQAPEEQFC